MVTPVAFGQIGPRYWIVFAVVGSIIPVTVYFFFPETVGRNLEELDLAFRESKSIFGVVAAARNIGRGETGQHINEKAEHRDEIKLEIVE